MNKMIFLIFTAFLIVIFYNSRPVEKITDYNFEQRFCNNDSLINWSSKIIKEKEDEFPLANDVFVKNDNDFVYVTWHYDIQNSESIKKDEYIQYCLDIILKSKIKIPKKFKLKFDYVLIGTCPVTSNLPIDVNSEIKNFRLIDKISSTEYEFYIVRGRLNSCKKYMKDEFNKIKDSAYITY